MALVAMPAGATFTRRAWTPPAQNQVNRSGWTGARQVVRLPGAALWKVSCALLPMSRESQTWPWKAFLAELEGEANTFLMPFACKQTAAPNPRVQTAVQGETTAQITGMPAGRLFLQAGRGLTFLHPSGKRQLVLLTRSLVADGAGKGLATFRGALRESPTVNSVVEARDPVCEMAMPANGGGVGWDENEGVYVVSWDAEEAFG